MVIKNPLQKHSKSVADRGYTPLPVNPETKQPMDKGWPGIQNDMDTLALWQKPRYHRASVGLLTKNTPALDFDILDPDISEHMLQFVIDNFEGEIVTRTGKAPKFLIPFRTDNPFKKMRSKRFEDFLGQSHLVEVLGSGQQFVAAGAHSSGVQYEWSGKLPVVSELSVLTPRLAQTVIDEFERVCAEQGMTEMHPGAGHHEEGVGFGGAWDIKNIITDKTEKQLLDALGRIPVYEDYDSWMRIIMAIHHQWHGSERGLQIAHHYSQKSAGYDEDELNSKWDSFKADSGGVTFATVLHLDPGAEEGDDDDDVTARLRKLVHADTLTVGAALLRIKEETKIPTSDLRAALGKMRREAALAARDIPWEDLSDKDAPLQTSRNMEILLEHLGAQLNFNDMSHEIEVVGVNTVGDSLIDSLNVRIGDYFVRDGGGYGRVAQVVKDVASENLYHPFDEYLADLPVWDGRDHVGKIFNGLQLKHRDISGSMSYPGFLHSMFEKWLVASVASVRRGPDTFPVRIVYVLTGGQNIGKTSWFRNLFPEGMFMDGNHLDPSNKDSIIQNTKHLCVELGELDATFTRKSISQLKAFISTGVDELRYPYDRGVTRHRRKTVYCGTVNDEAFLVDKTGNSRFIVADVESIDWSVKVNLEQLWAQVLHLFKGGLSWQLSHKEMAIQTGVNLEHDVKTGVDDAVNEHYDWQSETRVWKKISDIAMELGLKDAAIRNTAIQRQLKSAILGRTEARKNGHTKYVEYYIPEMGEDSSGF